MFKEYFDAKVSKYYLELLGNAVLSAAVTAVVYLIAVRFPVNTWYMLIAQGVVVGLVCAVIFIAVYFRTEGAQNIFQKVKALLQKCEA